MIVKPLVAADALHTKIARGTRTREHQVASNPRPGPRILDSPPSAGGKGVVRIEDRYGAGIDDQWSALTDPGRLASWYGQVEGDLRLGGQFRLHVEDADA